MCVRDRGGDVGDQNQRTQIGTVSTRGPLRTALLLTGGLVTPVEM